MRKSDHWMTQCGRVHRCHEVEKSLFLCK